MLRSLLSLTVVAVTALSSMTADAAPGDKSGRRGAALAGAQQRSAVGSNPGNPASANGTHLVPIEHSRFNGFGCRNTRKRCVRNLFGFAIVELQARPTSAP